MAPLPDKADKALMHTARSCGACSACCTLLEVPALEKPASEPCPYLAGSGCGRYSTRPEACQKFHCVWLLGPSWLHDDDRPDLLGVLVKMHVWSTPERPGWECWELRPGAFQSFRFQRRLRRIQGRLPIFLRALTSAEVLYYPPYDPSHELQPPPESATEAP